MVFGTWITLLTGRDTGNFHGLWVETFLPFLFFRDLLHLVNVMVTYKGRSREGERNIPWELNAGDTTKWPVIKTGCAVPPLTPFISPQSPGDRCDAADSNSRRPTARSSLSISPCISAILEEQGHKGRPCERQAGLSSWHHHQTYQRQEGKQKLLDRAVTT